MSGRLYR